MAVGASDATAEVVVVLAAVVMAAALVAAVVVVAAAMTLETETTVVAEIDPVHEREIGVATATAEVVAVVQAAVTIRVLATEAAATIRVPVIAVVAVVEMTEIKIAIGTGTLGETGTERETEGGAAATIAAMTRIATGTETGPRSPAAAAKTAALLVIAKNISRAPTV